ncbi:MAG TPA: caspase family protein [Gemmatimonadaceae bacterium]
MNSRERDYLWEREPSRFALVIGNAEYKHLALLESAKLDAEQMSGVLKRLGFTVTLVSRLPSVRNFEDSILPAFRKNIQRGDVVVFYFSGHGFAYGPHNYIAPADLPLVVSAELVGECAIAVESIEDYFARRSPGVVLMLIDACRAIGGFVIRASDNRNVVASGVAERARASESMNVVEAYAARAGSIALGSNAGDALSPFTRSLVAHIEMKDAEFTAMLRDVAADVLLTTHDSQCPGIVSWSACDLYLNPTARTHAQEKEAWLAALGSGAWDEVQRFTYRHALSRHAAAARQWLETHSQPFT